MYAIETEKLTKCYGTKRAADGLDMHVPEGAVYALIGENGSGKSTAQKLISGLIPKDGGTVRLYGKDVSDAGARSRIGVLIESPGCYPGISVYQNMRIHADSLGMKNPDEEIARVLKLVRMEGAASNKFRNCSLGMKQRIGIAFALLGSPDLLILDEPLNGLDADGMRIMRDIVRDVTRNRGATVLISSHLLGELEKVATHYGIIRSGRMLREMTADGLKKDCPVFVLIKTDDKGAAEAFLRQRGANCETAEDGIRVRGMSPEDAVMALYDAGIPVRGVSTERIGLEEYYVGLMASGRAS